MFPKVERLGDYIFTEGEHDAISVSQATSIPALTIIKNRDARPPEDGDVYADLDGTMKVYAGGTWMKMASAASNVARCMGCLADVPEWEQIDYLSRSGIICVDCHEAWNDQGSAPAAPASPDCAVCQGRVHLADVQVHVATDEKGQLTYVYTHKICAATWKAARPRA